MEYPDQNSLRDALRILVRGLVPALVIGAALGTAVYLLAQERPERFVAEASLLVVNSTATPGSFDVSLVTAPRIDAAAYRAAALSGPVLNGALGELGVTEPVAIDRQALADDTEIEISEMDASSVIRIATAGSTAIQASSRANALTDALLEWDQRRASRTLAIVAQTLEAQIAGADEQIASLQQAGAPQAQIDVRLAQRNDLSGQLNSARALMTSAVGRLEILDPAPVPSDPQSNRAVLLALAAFVFAAFTVYAILIVRNAMDTRVRSMAAFADAGGVPVIARFARTGRRTPRIDSETANYLRAHILHAAAGASPIVVVVTSPHRDRDRPKVAVALAESVARAGQRTLLIDANLRTPALGEAYDVRPDDVPDLEGYLADEGVAFEPVQVPVASGTDLLFVPSSGSTRPPSEMLDRAFGERLQQWKEHADVVVIDTPPILEVADVLAVAPHATGVLLVADLRTLTRRDARQAIEPLRHLGVPMFGATVSGAIDDSDAVRSRRPAPVVGLAPRRATSQIVDPSPRQDDSAPR